MPDDTRDRFDQAGKLAVPEAFETPYP